MKEDDPGFLLHPSFHNLSDHLPLLGLGKVHQELMVCSPYSLPLSLHKAEGVGVAKEGVEFTLDPFGRRRGKGGFLKLGDLAADPSTVLLKGFEDLSHGSSIRGRYDNGASRLNRNADRPPGGSTEFEMEGLVLKDELHVTVGNGWGHRRN